jgi:tRNA pseudouridine38-40 synthase
VTFKRIPFVALQRIEKVMYFLIMRYFFRVEYDGTNFGGWQSQTNAPSIQDELVKAFSVVTRETCEVTGAGRTDAGVHARGQGAHVDIAGSAVPARLELSVNAVLPPAISIYNLQAVAPDFHARFSAKKRRYRYVISFRKRPLLYKRVWMLFHDVNWDRIRENILSLLGTHDFSAFCASGSSAKTKFCTIHRAELIPEPDGVVFIIEADRFLYKMVRTIIGTLIDMGRGKITDSMETIIAGMDRARAGETAPACGLTLDYVEYPTVADR